jgi:hypothetical protein
MLFFDFYRSDKMYLRKFFIVVPVAILIGSIASAFPFGHGKIETADKVFDEAAKNTDETKYKIMSKEIAKLAQSESSGSTQAVVNSMKTIFVMCATTKSKPRGTDELGYCRDDDGKTYHLKGWSDGVFKKPDAVLLLGFIRTAANTIRGKYSMGQNGSGMAEGWPPQKTLRFANSANSYLGLDLVLGVSYETENTLVFVGPALEELSDISRSEITID